MYKVNMYVYADTKGPALQEAFYGYVLEYRTKRGKTEIRWGFGQEKETANGINIKALAVAAECLKKPCQICLYTNNVHLEAAIQNRWLHFWAENGWKNSAGKEIKNRELWEQAWKWLHMHQIRAVRGEEDPYREQIQKEIGYRKQKERKWAGTERQMAVLMKGGNCAVPNVS